MRLIKSIATVGGFTIGSRLVGFLREVLTASLLGAGPAADALVLAIKLPSFFRRLFAEGAFNAAFVPIFAGLLATNGEKDARSFAEKILTILTCSLLFLVIFVELFLPYILPVILPGFKQTPERLQYAIEFTRITFPFIFFISLTALYSGILNSLDRFAAGASSPMAGNLAIIAVVLSLHDTFQSPGFAFAMGVTACGILQLLWVLIPSWKHGMRLRLRKPSLSPSVRKFFVVMGPAAMGSGVVQINLFIGAFIASWLPTGAISYMNYADRLNQLPLSVIGAAVGTALLPLLSKEIRQGNEERAQFNQSTALEFSLFLVLPAMTGLMCMAPELIKMVFQRGAFSAEDTQATALTLQAFAIGLPAYVMIKVFSSIFFARQDTKTPIITAGIGIIVDIFLSIILMQTLAQVGIALATAAAAWVNAFLLAFILWRQGHLPLTQQLVNYLPKITACCGVMACSLFLIRSQLGDMMIHYSSSTHAVITMTMVGVGVVIFVCSAHLTGAMRLQHIKDLYKGRNIPAMN